MLRYNKTTPPDYDLSKVTVPTYVFYSKHDVIVIPEVIFDLLKLLHPERVMAVHVDRCESHHVNEYEYVQSNKTRKKRAKILLQEKNSWLNRKLVVFWSFNEIGESDRSLNFR